MSKCTKVLVVEDNQDIRESMVEVLVSEGFETTEASDGREALEALKLEKSPVLVFLDLMMPTMSGWELLDHQSVFRQNKVVIMSCFESTASLEDPTPLPVDASLQKPVTLSQVLEVAHRFADTSHAPKALAI